MQIILGDISISFPDKTTLWENIQLALLLEFDLS